MRNGKGLWIESWNFLTDSQTHPYFWIVLLHPILPEMIWLDCNLEFYPFVPTLPEMHRTPSNGIAWPCLFWSAAMLGLYCALKFVWKMGFEFHYQTSKLNSLRPDCMHCLKQWVTFCWAKGANLCQLNNQFQSWWACLDSFLMWWPVATAIFNSCS